MSDPVGCQCPECLRLASAPPANRLSRALGRWFEALGRCYMYAEGMHPEDAGGDLWDGRALDPGEAYIVNGIDEIGRFLAERLGRHGRGGGGDQWR